MADVIKLAIKIEAPDASRVSIEIEGSLEAAKGAVDVAFRMIESRLSEEGQGG